MAKPWSNFNRQGVRLVLALVLAVPFLTSCLDLEVSTVFKTSTSGTIEVNSLAYRIAQGLQFVDGTDRVPLPTTQAGWMGIAGQVPGASLVSWSGSDEDLGFRSRAVLSFSNARSLEGLFVVFKQKLTLLQDTQGKWTLTFVPQVPRVTAADPAARKLWTDLWGKVVWTFGFTPPAQPRVDRTVTLAELAGSRPPAEWTVTW